MNVPEELLMKLPEYYGVFFYQKREELDVRLGLPRKKCTDAEDHYYVALCTDMDLLGYCVVKTGLTQLRDMLYGNISMRDIFTEQKFFWQVISKDGKAENDIVTYKPIDEFEPEDLPLENAFFRLFSNDLKDLNDGTKPGKMMNPVES